MDTLNDWTDDGYETQLVSLETQLVPVETRVVPFQAQVVPVETQLVPVETQLAPIGTQLVPVAGEDISPLVSPDSSDRDGSGDTNGAGALEADRSESAQSSSGEPNTAAPTSTAPAHFHTGLESSELEPFPQKSSKTGKPEKEVSKAFLDYFLRYPIISNLRDADLLNKQEVLEAARIWKQMGGKLEHVLVDRMGIKSTTIKFFSNNEAGSSAKQQGCKRIGEFLRAAGLVSEGEIQFVLEELKKQGRTLKLGDALVEQGLVKQSTINYFANRFVNENLGFGARNSGEHAQDSENFFDDDSHFRLDEFFLVVGQHGQFSSHTLRTRMYSIGRGIGNDIVVNDKFVSRRHAYLIRTKNKESNVTTYEVLDCGKVHKYSTNGIYVNGKKVKHRALNAGDVIHIGPKIQARFLPVE